MSIKQTIGPLSRIDKIFLVALAVRLAYGLINTLTHADPPGAGWVRVLFVLVGIVFLIASFPKWARMLLWRVRHRLLVTWVLVGVVPIVLVCALVTEGVFILLGQMVSYMTTTEINRQNETVRSLAYTLAWQIAHRPASSTPQVLTDAFVREIADSRKVTLGAVVRSGKDLFAVPADGAIQAIPEWSMPEFRGVVASKDVHYLAAHVAAGDSANRSEVFLYQLATPDFFQNLLSGIAVISIDQGTASANGLNFYRTEESRSGFSINSGRASDDPDFKRPPAPPGRGWWDLPISWFVLMPNIDLMTGKGDDGLAIVASRLSLISNELFKFKASAAFVFVVMFATAVVFLVVELVAVVFAGTLTRSITRSVADIYAGTTRVQAGDFANRIPVRKTKDQLSELAGSFNTMTGRIEELIVEEKEKEKLENELAIARDVQTQLFPKEIPQMKTLEMWGGCQPARTVSGDYYDFVSLDSDRVALAIGDISGKGISAALLMAHIQSALRTQLMHHNGNGHGSANGTSSPASILSILNDHLFKSSPPEKYATFFLGLYSDEGGQFIYTNAGHLAPMVVRRGEVLRLPGEGFPVGLFPGVQYDQQVFTLEPGDLLVAFTDGVTETPNYNGDEFGDQRLTELLTRHSQEPLERIAEEISTAVGAWAGDRERHDDTTLLLARRLP